jgi:uncharacterized protein (DUF924 family)
MSVKLLSESRGATITDEDQARIDAILAFWFKEHELSAPQIDRRMDIWFGEDPAFDHEIQENFSADVAQASEGRLDHWADEPRGRLALILLLDQFRRNIYRGSAKALSRTDTNPAGVLLYAAAARRIAKGAGQVRRAIWQTRRDRVTDLYGNIPYYRAVRRTASGHH